MVHQKAAEPAFAALAKQNAQGTAYLTYSIVEAILALEPELHAEAQALRQEARRAIREDRR
jgi:hypothetical protein